MVLAGKVFLVRENYDMDTLAEKLKAFRIETETSVEDKEFKLVSEIMDLNAGKGLLEGKFSFDTVFVVPHRGNSVPVPRTFEAPFSFNMHKERMFLTVYDKKNRANNIANEMSKAVFMSLHGKLWYIVFTSKAYGYVFGLTRNCILTGFSKMELSEFKSYVGSQVFPLIA